MSDETSEILRRAAPRYGCAGDAEIVLPGRGLRYPGRIGDLSIGGCSLETRCRLERGTAVEIWMNAQGQPLRVAANLMVQRENGAGFRFHSVTARKLLQIRSLIAELAEDEARRKACGESAEEILEHATRRADGDREGDRDAAEGTGVPGRWRRWLTGFLRRWKGGNVPAV
jgi:hypothetical protein